MRRKLAVMAAILLAALVAVRTYRAALVRRLTQQRAGITADYVCEQNKTMRAVFVSGRQPRVELSLGDGRHLTLPRAPAASGTRYASADESTVFWSKGDTAFLMEGGTQTYANCRLR
jgi:membrane-bound inhibitor of C-type lysozyme